MTVVGDRVADRIDTRARQILFDLVDARMRCQPLPPAADLAYAKRKRMLFAPVTATHDVIVGRTLKAVAKLSLAQVSAAFLASLTSGRHDLRSGLASYVQAREMKRHRYVNTGPFNWCDHCETEGRYREFNLEFPSYLRHKDAGGGMHGSPIYRMFDLEELAREAPIVPTKDDVAIMSAIVSAIGTAGTDDTPPKLSTRLKRVLPASTKAERFWLVIGLARCQVIVAKEERKGHADWIDARSWRGSDGVNAKQVRALFGMHGVTVPAKR